MSASTPYNSAVAYTWPTITDVAHDVIDALRRGEEDEARRLVFRFVESYDKAPAEDHRGMVGDEPPATGDQRFDAFLAAIVEYLCAREFVVPPTWVDSPNRFLDRWWFMSGIRALHANAIVHSPISFARRGVFITQGALTYA